MGSQECLLCNKTVVDGVNGFCDEVCQGTYYGSRSLKVDYGTAVCSVCDKEFDKKSTNQVYCGNACRKRNLNERRRKEYASSKSVHKMECAKCGADFEAVSKSSKYCSVDCSSTAFKHKCARCNEVFYTGRSDSKICNNSCKRPRHRVQCNYCKLPFDTLDKNAKYCARTCWKKSKRVSHKEFIDQVIDVNDGTIVPLEMHTGSNELIKCKCLLCDRVYNKEAYKFIGRFKEGCNCISSKGEVAVNVWLSSVGIEFIEQYCFDDLKHKGKLFFDFAIIKDDEVEALIEYDGKQHFERPKRWSQKKFDEQIARDSMKDRYCLEKGIPLIRVPYYEKDIENFLEKRMAGLQVEV